MTPRQPASRRPGRRAATALLAAAVVLAAVPAVLACCLPQQVIDHRWKCFAPLSLGCTFKGPVTDGAGGVYVLRNAADGTLVVVVSRDDGNTFSETPVPNSAVRSAGLAAIAASDGGDVVVAWTDADDHGLRIADSHDQAQTFTPPRMLAYDGLRALGLLNLGATARGFVLTWQEATFVGAVPSELWSVASVDEGRTWSAPVEIDDPGLGLWDAAALLTSGEDVVTSWLQGDPATIMVDSSHDGGMTWSTDVPLARAVLGRTTQLSTDGAGAFQVLSVQDGATGSLQMSASLDAGRTWGGAELIAPATTLGASVALPDGRVIVAYTSDAGGRLYDTWAAISSDRGQPGTFGAPTLLAAALYRTDELYLARGTESRPWLLQGDYRDSAGCASIYECESVYLSPGCKSLPEGLPPTVQVDRDDGANLSHSEDGRLAISPSGRVQVFWMDGGGIGSYELRHAAHVRSDAMQGVDYEMLGPLYVSKLPGAVRLSWADARAEASHYDVLEGTIASLHLARTYDHEGNPCGLLRAPAPATSTTIDEVMPAGDAYWLIAAENCMGAGAAGYDSFGRLTPPAGGAAAPCAAPR